jgi:hypothetical protein
MILVATASPRPSIIVKGGINLLFSLSSVQDDAAES